MKIATYKEDVFEPGKFYYTDIISDTSNIVSGEKVRNFLNFILSSENAGIVETKNGTKKVWIGGLESTDTDIIEFVEKHLAIR